MTHPALSLVAALYDPADIIEIRLIHPRPPAGTTKVVQEWTVAANYAARMRLLSVKSAEGYGIYHGANPRREKGLSGDDSVPLARTIFADFDPKGGRQITLEAVLAKIKELGLPPPTFAVKSGRGIHVYWVLARPVAAPLEAWVSAMKATADLLSSDRVIANPERVMRTPGFPNTKTDPPTPTEFVDLSGRRDYTLADFPTGPAQRNAEERRPTQAAQPSRAGSLSERYALGVVATSEKKILASTEGQRNVTLNTAALFVGHYAGHLTDVEGALNRLEQAALAVGLEPSEVASTIASGFGAGIKEPRDPPLADQRFSTDRPQAVHLNGQAVHPSVESPEQVASKANPYQSVTATQLIAQHPEYRPVLIDGLLRNGEVMNVVAAPKIGKSWLVHGLACAVAAGRPWMDMRTVKSKVLLIDAELHHETLARRLDNMGRSTNTPLPDMDDIHVHAVRGRGLSVLDVGAVVRQEPAGTYGLIILDALYRFLPGDTDENSNSAIMRVYNELDQIARTTGASIAVVHHASKGNQSEKAVTDVGAGAGSQSRAADTHLILRAHQEDGAAAVEAVVRSFKPMEPFCIRRATHHYGWELAKELDATLLKGMAKPARDKPLPPPMPSISDFVEKIFSGRPRTEPEVVEQAKTLGLSRRDALKILYEAVDAKAVSKDRDGHNRPFLYTPYKNQIF